jgi:hypothetical protein
MSRVVDNLVAYRVLSMLVKPFVETDAYKLGIIDSKGKTLIKSSDFKTGAQRDAFTYLHRLVFNMKKIINKLPGGENKLKSVVSALFLVKEYYESNNRSTSMMEERFHALMQFDGILAEETILVEKYMKDLEEDGMGGGAVSAAPANVTGSMVSTDIPVPKKKDLKKYKQNQENLGGPGLLNLTRRPEPKL